MAFLPLTISLTGPPACWAGSLTVHFPSSPATVEAGIARAQTHAYLLTGIGPAPDGNGLLPLKDHMVAENLGQADISLAGGRQAQCNQGKAEDLEQSSQLHGVLAFGVLKSEGGPTDGCHFSDLEHPNLHLADAIGITGTPAGWGGSQPGPAGRCARYPFDTDVFSLFASDSGDSA